MQNKKKGFTLIELLVTVTIIGIMTSVVLAFTMRDKTQEEVSVAADELAARITDMRQRALAGNAGSGNTACGFGVNFTGTSYKTFYSAKADPCPTEFDGGGSLHTPMLYTWGNTKVKVDGGVNKNIFFRVPFGEMEATVTNISVSVGTQIKCVHVSVTGIVSVSDASCS